MATRLPPQMQSKVLAKVALTAVAITKFQEILEAYSAKKEGKDLESVIHRIERVRNQNPSVYDESSVQTYLTQRAALLRNLVQDYFTTAMSTKFPLISDELFELKRYLAIKQEGKTYKIVQDWTKTETSETESREEKVRTVEAPLFAYTPLFKGKHKAKLGKFTKTIKSTSGSTRRRTIAIEAKLPGSIGPNLKKAYRESLIHYFGVLSEMFTNPVAGDILYSQEDFINPEIAAIWIPTPESLSVSVTEELIQERPQIDPAMILKVKGKSYLVTTWNIDEEEPFKQYLRKYSHKSS